MSHCYFIEDAANFYDGRKVEFVRYAPGADVWVRVCGTKVEILLSLYQLRHA